MIAFKIGQLNVPTLPDSTKGVGSSLQEEGPLINVAPYNL